MNDFEIERNISSDNFTIVWSKKKQNTHRKTLFSMKIVFWFVLNHRGFFLIFIRREFHWTNRSSIFLFFFRRSIIGDIHAINHIKSFYYIQNTGQLFETHTIKKKNTELFNKWCSRDCCLSMIAFAATLIVSNMIYVAKTLPLLNIFIAIFSSNQWFWD